MTSRMSLKNRGISTIRHRKQWNFINMSLKNKGTYNDIPDVVEKPLNFNDRIPGAHCRESGHGTSRDADPQSIGFPAGAPPPKIMFVCC